MAVNRVTDGLDATPNSVNSRFPPMRVVTTEDGDTTNRTTRASAVQAAIDDAGTNNYEIVYVPDDFLNYDASSVNFTNNSFSGRLVREGQIADVYDAKAYGAAGDGSQDDQPSIQALIDLLEADADDADKIVWMPPGTFRLNSGLTVEAGNLAIKGEGLRATKIEYHGSGTAIQVGVLGDTLFGWELHDFQLDDAGGTGTKGIDIVNASEGICQGVELTGSGDSNNSWDTAAITLRGDSPDPRSVSNYFLHCRIAGTGGQGIRLEQGSNATRLAGCMIFDNVSAGIIFLGSMSGVRIDGCQLERNGPVAEGQIYASNTGLLKAVQITDCYFEFDNRAIRIDESNGSVDVRALKINGCYMAGSDGPARAIELRQSVEARVTTTYIQQVTGEGIRLIGGALCEAVDVEAYSDVSSTAVDVLNPDSSSLAVEDGVAEESANAEEPQESWPTGTVVDFTDSGDGSGTGIYQLMRDDNWTKLA